MKTVVLGAQNQDFAPKMLVTDKVGIVPSGFPANGGWSGLIRIFDKGDVYETTTDGRVPVRRDPLQDHR
jgi:hypothetical protein